MSVGSPDGILEGSPLGASDDFVGVVVGVFVRDGDKKFDDGVSSSSKSAFSSIM